MEAFFSSPILTNILLLFILMSALYIANILIDFKQEVNDGREGFKSFLRAMLPVKGDWYL